MRFTRYLALLLVLPFGLLLGFQDSPTALDREKRTKTVLSRSTQAPPTLDAVSPAPSAGCTFNITMEVVALNDVVATVTVLSCPGTIEL